MKKKFSFIILSLIVGIILFAFVLLRTGVKDTFRVIELITIPEFVLVLVIFFLHFYFTVLSLQIILKSYHYKIPIKKLFPIHIIKYTMGYVTPFMGIGGEPVAVFLLEKKYDVPPQKGSSAVIIERMIRLTISVLAIFFGVVILLLNIALPENAKILLIIPTAFLIYLLYFFYKRIITGKSFCVYFFYLFKLNKFKDTKGLLHILHEADENMSKFIRYDKKSFILTTLVSILGTTMIFVLFYFILFFLNFQSTFTNLLLVYTFISLLITIPIPASLGVLEAVQAVIFGAQKIGADIGVAFSLIFRALSIISILISFIILSRYKLNLKSILRKLIR